MTRLIASAIALAMLGGTASAQTTRTATILPDKPVRIAVITAFKKDCTLGEVGSIRVVTAPKNGSIVVRGGNLKTPSAYRCPSKDTAVQQLFYQSNKNFEGTDELSYETKDTDGTTQTVNVKLNVSKKPAEKPKSGGSGGVVDL